MGQNNLIRTFLNCSFNIIIWNNYCWSFICNGLPIPLLSFATLLKSSAPIKCSSSAPADVQLELKINEANNQTKEKHDI